VHALMRQPQQASGIARAHFRSSGSEHANGASCRAGCSTVFYVVRFPARNLLIAILS